MFDGLNILIADDSAQTLEMLSFIFESEGAHVSTAINGQEAIQKTRNDAYDVILMDIQMPICDGIEATRCIRQDGVLTPIIAVTAATDLEAQGFIAKGFTDYYLKPVDFKRLNNKVTSCVQASANQTAVSSV